jgi:hypothetical protein
MRDGLGSPPLFGLIFWRRQLSAIRTSSSTARQRLLIAVSRWLYDLSNLLLRAAHR